MKKNIFILAILILCLGFYGYAEKAPKELKVFISVDMEGICGVIHWEEVSRNGKDYDLFRKLMTLETNAAIEGALEAGATEILVRDSHGSGRNILPELLHPAAQLIRDWSGGPLSMMEGIDSSYHAAIFIGYHAQANTPNAVLDHTMTGTIYDVTLNGKKMPETGINAFIAGNFNVPVILVAGDKAICSQAQELLGQVETVAVKEGIGNAAKMLHPEKALALIKEKTTAALKRIKDFKPFKLTPPYTIEVTFKDEERAENASWIPGAKRTGPTSVSFTSSDFMEVLRFFKFAR
ncbi:MAG: M55 family metallopeptidase [Candidatus Aminicenantes bacterium]|nr:M55 family metallopeptidase [Candidatus Aminicenantes bacterium]